MPSPRPPTLPPGKSVTEERMKLDREWLETLLRQAQSQQFFGKIIINMDAGRVLRVINERSLRPPHATAGEG